MKFDKKVTKNQLGKAAQNIGQKAQRAANFLAKKGKEGGNLAIEKYGVVKNEIDKKILSPVFANEVEGIINSSPYILRIVEHNKKRESNEACTDSVGFYEKIKGQNILHIYSQEAEKMAIIFYPSVKETLYCPNPYDPRMYICIEDYFDYIKKAKVDELETIGHKLGAKNIKITFKERKTYLLSKVANSTGMAKKLANGNIVHTKNTNDFSDIRVAAEVEFRGGSQPVRPGLVYFANESDIKALIDMRMDTQTGNNIKSKTYTFESSSRREMSEETALKIDSIISGLKCVGNSSVISKVQEEKRTVLEYSIIF